MLNYPTEIDQETERIVKSIGIPPCPGILATLVREMRADDPDFARIANLIGSDVGLAAAMLKTVNSPLYGLPTKARSVSQALALLGLRTVTQLITGLLLRQAFPVADSDFMEDYWETSSRLALLTAFLASKVKGVARDDAHTFGLFRDCGMPHLMLTFDDYEKALAAAQANPERRMTDIEADHFAITHAQVGSYLARNWHLPEQVWLAILFHHDYSVLSGERAGIPTAGLRLIALGLLAEHLLRTYCGEAPTAEWRQSGAYALDRIGLSADEAADLLPEVTGMLDQGCAS